MRRIFTLAILSGSLLASERLAVAEEKLSVVQTALSSTTLSGYVDVSGIWMSGTASTTQVVVVREVLSGYPDWLSRFRAWLRGLGMWIAD